MELGEVRHEFTSQMRDGRKGNTQALGSIRTTHLNAHNSVFCIKVEYSESEPAIGGRDTAGLFVLSSRNN